MVWRYAVISENLVVPIFRVVFFNNCLFIL